MIKNIFGILENVTKLLVARESHHTCLLGDSTNFLRTCMGVKFDFHTNQFKAFVK